MNSLTTDLDGREHTTLTYEATYYPQHVLFAHHRIQWHRTLVVSKSQLLTMLDPQQANARLLPSQCKSANADKPIRWFPIVWEYNNIPNEAEWNQLSGMSFISINFRVSPCIRNSIGRAAVLRIYRRVKLSPRALAESSQENIMNSSTL